MRKLSRSARALLTIAGFLVLLFVAALILVPPLSSARVESMIKEKLESRGLSVSSLDAKLRADGRLIVSELCVNDLAPFEAERLACVTDLSVNVAILDALRGTPQIEEVSADSIEVWMPRERGTITESKDRFLRLLSKIDDDPDTDEDSDDEDDGRLSSLRSIEIASVSMHLDGHPGVSGAQRVEAIVGNIDGNEASIAFNVFPGFNPDALIPSGLGITVPESLRVEAVLTVDDPRLESLEATFGSPLRVDVDRAGHAGHGELSGVSFDAPYEISLIDPTIVMEDAVDFHASSVVIEPGSWSTDLDKIFIANLVLTDPVVEAQNIAALKALAVDLLGSDTNAMREEEPTDPSPSDENVAEEEAEPSIQQLISTELGSRKWWEVLPRRLETRDGTIRLASSEARPSIEWTQMNFVYAMRYIRFQMDIETNGQLYVGAQNVGDIGLEGFWNYQEGNLNADLSIDQLHVEPLTKALSSREDFEIGGVVNSKLHVSGGLKEGFAFLLSGDFEEPYAELPLFDGQYAFGNVGFTLPGRFEKSEGEWSFSLNAENIEVDNARFAGGISATGLGVDGLIANRLEFHIEIPDQPVENLFSAVPEPILGPLAGTSMSGDFGLTLKFPVLLSRDDDDTLAVQIEDPTAYDFRDGDLALIELPEDVDVRRLNRSLTFIFRGPDDAIMRRLRIPAPSLMRNYDGISETDETPINWTRLWDISFYVVAAQLYREDGSFFRNSGINWYQLRRVAAEAIEARKLGRGASTISMQLVKNLFLSHERSLERKLQELFLTYWMTRIVPKERVLEVYLNVIEWGPNLNGITEAAEFYFEKDPAALSAIEGTWLSSITPDPVDLGGDRPRREITAATCSRCRALVEGLSRRGWISRMETDVALETPQAPLFPRRDFELRPTTGSGVAGSDPFDDLSSAPSGEFPLRIPFGDGEAIETPSDFQLMSPKERLRDWVNSSRSLRGDGR